MVSAGWQLMHKDHQHRWRFENADGAHKHMQVQK